MGLVLVFKGLSQLGTYTDTYRLTEYVQIDAGAVVCLRREYKKIIITDTTYKIVNVTYKAL